MGEVTAASLTRPPLPDGATSGQHQVASCSHPEIPSPEPVLDFLLSALHWLGVTLYGGGLIGGACLMLAARVLDPVDVRVVMRAWRYWGAILGLSMGALILGGLGLR